MLQPCCTQKVSPQINSSQYSPEYWKKERKSTPGVLTAVNQLHWARGINSLEKGATLTYIVGFTSKNNIFQLEIVSFIISRKYCIGSPPFYAGSLEQVPNISINPWHIRMMILTGILWMCVSNIHFPPSDPYPVLLYSLESEWFGTVTTCKGGA